MLNYPKNFYQRPLIIRSHYGDESIALVQWVYERIQECLPESKLQEKPNKPNKQIEVVNIDTGFAAERWSAQIALGEAHAQACGFKTITITSSISFSELVQSRAEFPSSQFLWCASMLKGLPFLDWLDTWDPGCQAIIVYAKRRMAAKSLSDLPEWIERCEYHGERTVWHPMVYLDQQERDALLTRAGIKPLNHRSLECDPCVNSRMAELSQLSNSDIEKTFNLESALKTPMFSLGILELIEYAILSSP